MLHPAFIPAAAPTSAFAARPRLALSNRPRFRAQTRRSRSRLLPVRMVVVPSNMLPLGTLAPDFSLLEPSTGETRTFDNVKGPNGTLVMFLCSRCPFVVLLKDEIRRLGAELREQGIGMVGISSNDVVNYPHDDVEPMKITAREMFPTFSYVIDKTQHVAKAYMAACTPDIFLFDAQRKLVYRGQFDHARPGNGVAVTGCTIREAISLVLKGEQMPEDEMWPSIGCHIKWIEGNEPSYFG